MVATTSRMRLSSSARRSGVSSGPASISRIQSRSTSGSAASNTRCSAACPPERARSSGSCPSGSSANRSDLPGSSAAKPRRRPGRRRAGRPCRRRNTGSARPPCATARSSCSGVSAVPSGATALAKPASRHGDHVDIALDRDHRAAVMRRLAGVVVVVEHLALVEERRIGAVQVLGGDILLQRPAAEGDGPPARVEDREHDPVAEAVIGNRRRPRAAPAARPRSWPRRARPCRRDGRAARSGRRAHSRCRKRSRASSIRPRPSR